MMALFNQTALECSRLITKRYSTSFTLGIKTLDRKLHFPIYAIYGFVRYADEIVDTFHEYDKKTLLERFKHDTYQAIDEGISLNPILQSFQLVVKQYGIDLALIEDFLKSMEMDLYQQSHTEASYDTYIYGSAEAVGLMCLYVFCEGNTQEFERLREPAQKLGAAFQKVNFLRDLRSDFVERGRTYFPGVDFNDFSRDTKCAIEEDIQRDFDMAYTGIKQLPRSARMGVYLAYLYYQTLFNKIKRLSTNCILTKRVRVPNPQKIALLAQTYLKFQLNSI